MDYKYIEQLLNRYFEAATTLKEEQILKTFFAQDDEEMPSNLRYYKSLFAALEPKDVLESDFDERILSLTVNSGKTQQNDHEQTATTARIIRLADRLQPLLRAAAVVAIILTMSTAINQSFRDDNVWTDDDMIAHYQDEMRKAALAAASSDSTILFTEGIGVRSDSIIADTLCLTKGYLE